MKPYLTTLTFLLVAQFAFAQPLQYSANPTMILKRFTLVYDGPLEDKERTFFFFNAAGHLEGTLTEHFKDGVWIHHSKTLISPNPDGTANQITHYTAVPDSTLWDEDEREYFYYDAYKRDTLWLKRYKYSNWDIKERLTKSYNLDGKLLKSLSELGSSGYFFSKNENTYSYNSQGQITYHGLKQTSYGNIFTNSNTTYEYDDQGRLTIVFGKRLDGTTGYIVPSYKTENIYEDWDNRVDYQNRWSWASAFPEPIQQTLPPITYTYTDSSTVASTTTLAESWRYTTIYNNERQITKSHAEKWSAPLQLFVTFTRKDNTYNSDGSYQKELYYSEYEYDQLKRYEYIYTYDQTTPTTSTALDVELRLFPNPTNDFAHIIINSKDKKHPIYCTIYNTEGRQIHRDVFTQGSNMLHLSQYPAGMYFLRVEQGGDFKTIPLIKQ
jgi:hypothetical protein